MAQSEIGKAGANPTKAFFVRMITRDISLEDCILDLIDNSVDGAWRCEGSRPMGLALGADLSQYEIKITAKPDKFCIEDNCGGMTFEDAVNHAFSFGRPEKADTDDFSIGIYGIGMKRAVFKLGADITVRSTFTKPEGDRASFAVPIVVSEWLKDDVPPWDFKIVSDTELEQDGVQINIKSLTSSTEASFGSLAFLQSLKRTISRDYSLHLHRGLRIVLNDVPIVGWQIEMLESDVFAPMRVSYRDDFEGSPVDVEIIGGMAAPPPDTSDPDIEDDGEKRYGWYIVCNGRIVLAADKSSVSGWGTDDWPQWHRQYSGFIGIILFTAANAAALPLTTTKRSVDSTSEVYRRARPKMRELTRAWINYTNQRKQSLDEAKSMEAIARPVAIHSLSARPAAVFSYVTPRPTEKVANVNYSVKLQRMKNLAKALGSPNLKYRDVGLQAFDYMYDDIVGKD
ncbi:MAG: ATP-binding protein [Sphingomonadales bacterium 28-64-96]|nr:MAG: ATP-binding protein [Sphingomonadales bacterium 28-64-96]